MRRINAGSGITHDDEDAALVLLGANQQLSNPSLNCTHRFDRVENEVQDDLLQLHTITMNMG